VTPNKYNPTKAVSGIRFLVSHSYSAITGVCTGCNSKPGTEVKCCNGNQYVVGRNGNLIRQ
jgi:hypothetical protein